MGIDMNKISIWSNLNIVSFMNLTEQDLIRLSKDILKDKQEDHSKPLNDFLLFLIDTGGRR